MKIFLMSLFIIGFFATKTHANASHLFPGQEISAKYKCDVGPSSSQTLRFWKTQPDEGVYQIEWVGKNIESGPIEFGKVNPLAYISGLTTEGVFQLNYFNMSISDKSLLNATNLKEGTYSGKVNMINYGKKYIGTLSVKVGKPKTIKRSNQQINVTPVSTRFENFDNQNNVFRFDSNFAPDYRLHYNKSAYVFLRNSNQEVPLYDCELLTFSPNLANTGLPLTSIQLPKSGAVLNYSCAGGNSKELKMKVLKSDGNDAKLEIISTSLTKSVVGHPWKLFLNIPDFIYNQENKPTHVSKLSPEFSAKKLSQTNIDSFSSNFETDIKATKTKENGNLLMSTSYSEKQIVSTFGELELFPVYSVKSSSLGEDYTNILYSRKLQAPTKIIKYLASNRVNAKSSIICSLRSIDQKTK